HARSRHRMPPEPRWIDPPEAPDATGTSLDRPSRGTGCHRNIDRSTLPRHRVPPEPRSIDMTEAPEPRGDRSIDPPDAAGATGTPMDRARTCGACHPTTDR